MRFLAQSGYAYAAIFLGKFSTGSVCILMAGSLASVACEPV
jgi:hypothetical protein